MSEMQSLADAKPAPKKLTAKAPRKTKAKAASGPRIKLSAAAEAAPAAKEDIPAGFAACYVAIPGKVSRGGGMGKANAGERLICGDRNIDELEMRGLAFRAEDEAKAAFAMHKRKEEKRIADLVNAERLRRERRERIKAELYGAGGLEWNG